jgi:hypothetical protein
MVNTQSALLYTHAHADSSPPFIAHKRNNIKIKLIEFLTVTEQVLAI